MNTEETSKVAFLVTVRSSSDDRLLIVGTRVDVAFANLPSDPVGVIGRVV